MRQCLLHIQNLHQNLHLSNYYNYHLFRCKFLLRLGERLDLRRCSHRLLGISCLLHYGHHCLHLCSWLFLYRNNSGRHCPGRPRNTLLYWCKSHPLPNLQLFLCMRYPGMLSCGIFCLCRHLAKCRMGTHIRKSHFHSLLLQAYN